MNALKNWQIQMNAQMNRLLLNKTDNKVIILIAEVYKKVKNSTHSLTLSKAPRKVATIGLQFEMFGHKIPSISESN